MNVVDWTSIPADVAVVVLLIREVSRFMRERYGEKGVNGSIGSKSIEFWEAKQREIAYTELERHVIPRLDELQRVVSAMHDNVRELRWRGQQGKKGE